MEERGVLALGRCAVLTIFLVVWMERNRRIFEKARDEEVDLLSDKVHFWDSLGHLGLLSLGIIFFHAISFDWNASL